MPNITSLLIRLISIGNLPDDSLETQIKKQFVCSMGMLMSVGGLIWGTICFYYGVYLPGMIPYGYTFFTIINFTYFYFFKNFPITRRIQVILSLMLPFMFQWSLGGFVPSGGMMLWAILSLLGSISFDEIKNVYKWLVVFIMLTVFSGIIDHKITLHSITVEPTLITIFFVLNLGVISTIVVFLVLYFEQVRDKATLELRESNQRVLEQKEKLQHTINQLQMTQSQLVRSEKLAVLGQLVAGIAHEVNTPLGAIKASAEELAMTYAECMMELPKLYKQLNETRQKHFGSLLEKALKSGMPLSSKEERAVKKMLRDQLADCEVPEARFVADRLAQAGISEELSEDEIEFLKDGGHISEIAANAVYSLAGQQKNTRNISTAVEKASRVILALKNYARMDHENKLIDTDVRESVETVLTIYHNQIKKGVDLIREYGEGDFIIPAHPDRLNQLWTNLIHNAIQAMNHQGVLTVNIKRQNGHVIVGIGDNGPGIPEHIRARIFEPFFTTKPAGEGSGLGLDIVRQIVEEHQGKIGFQTELGVGTTFIAEFPIASHEGKAQ